ncbi:hypothetical protein SprV_0401621200 [Sparganum proliferum]
MTENACPRRCRKSAPVKNAVFVGAANKGRSKLRELGNECIIKQVSRDHSVSDIDGSESQNDRVHQRFSVRSRRRSRHSRDAPRMSTPMGRDRSSLRPSLGGEVRHSGESNHSLLNLPDVGKRRYHPKYDPYIEIRRARERLSQYKTKGDWATDMLLSDDAEEDLQRYEEKLKRRYSQRGEFSGELELERRQMELLRRQRDIDMGKVTERYAEYVLTIPKPERQKHHPRTPNKFRTVSRRAWDGMIKKWRKHLHYFDSPDFNETWRSLATDVSLSSCGSYASSQNGSHSESMHASSDEACESNITEKPPSENDPVLSSLSTVRAGKAWSQRHNIPVIMDEEDTLQGLNKASAANAGGIASTTEGLNSDEETLHASDVASRFNLRARPQKFDLSGRFAPAPDVLHSGLTNDMYSLSSKRGRKASGSEGVAPPEILSPTKKTRRPSGNTGKISAWNSRTSTAAENSAPARKSSGKLKSPR